jgi:hypothetical protein
VGKGEGKEGEVMKLTHIAKKDRKCHKCGGAIPAGSQYLQRRERAVSSHEASHAGTLYPVRHICAACAHH